MLCLLLVSGAVALETPLVEGKAIPTVVGASANGVLAVGLMVALDDGGGEDVLLLVVVRLLVVCVSVVVVTLLVVSVSFTVSVVASCRTRVLFVVEAEVTVLSEVVVAALVPFVGSVLLERVRAGGSLGVFGWTAGRSVGDGNVLFTSSIVFLGVKVKFFAEGNVGT